jgi:hypothetical protein
MLTRCQPQHPELHAKMMGEMRHLIDVNCKGSAVIIAPDSIKCLWCNSVLRCPPYRPHSYYLKNTASTEQPEGASLILSFERKSLLNQLLLQFSSGHHWTCRKNPNACIQSGLGMNLGGGRVML